MCTKNKRLAGGSGYHAYTNMGRAASRYRGLVLQVRWSLLERVKVTDDGRVGLEWPAVSHGRQSHGPEAGGHHDQGGAQRRRKRPTTLACMRRQKDGGLLFDSDCPSSVTPIRAWLGLGLGVGVGLGLGVGVGVGIGLGLGLARVAAGRVARRAPRAAVLVRVRVRGPG